MMALFKKTFQIPLFTLSLSALYQYSSMHVHLREFTFCIHADFELIQIHCALHTLILGYNPNP